jgi:hypothetical protein
MKKINLLFISIIFFSVVSGQTSQIPQDQKFSTELTNEKDVFNKAALSGRTLYESFALFDMKTNPPINAEDVIFLVRAYLAEVPTEDKYDGNIAEWNLIKKYYSNIEKLFDKLGLMGSDQLGQFLFFKGVNLPIKFALYGTTETSVIVQNVYIDNVYNTIQLTSKQRATRVMTGYILPELASIAEAFPGEEIKYYGMTCIYGSKDFTDKSKFALRGEFVGFIAPSKIIKQYIAGDITEDDLVSASSIFISDREMVSGIKKVSIVIE